MKKRMIGMVALTLGMAFPAFSAEGPLMKGVEGALDTFAEGCQTELTTFCKDVTPGEGRLLACLYAFGDKLSPQCEYALYDSMAQLNKTLTNAAYAINECEDDLDALCADRQPGEGRLLDCLKKNEAKVSSRCKTALKNVGWIK